MNSIIAFFFVLGVGLAVCAASMFILWCEIKYMQQHRGRRNAQ